MQIKRHNLQLAGDLSLTGSLQETNTLQEIQSQWVQQDNGQRFLSVSESNWESPAIEVRPFAYFKVRFLSRAAQNGFCWAQFYDAVGKPLVADDHDNFWASENWSEQFLVFRAHALARHVRIFVGVGQSPVDIADIGVWPISQQEVAAWSHSIAGRIPDIHYSPPPERGTSMTITASRLKSGGTLRIVMLGDSICNDISNSLFEAQLHERYPRTNFEVVASVRGGTGCPYYGLENRVAKYVLLFQPDLLIIAGISHHFDAEAVTAVIEQTRACRPCDILVLNDSITPQEKIVGDYLKKSGLPPSIAKGNVQHFPERLSALASIAGAEFLDARSAWTDYLSSAKRPVQWFLRDNIHGNMRARQVLGEILARYLAFAAPNS